MILQKDKQNLTPSHKTLVVLVNPLSKRKHRFGQTFTACFDSYPDKLEKIFNSQNSDYSNISLASVKSSVPYYTIVFRTASCVLLYKLSACPEITTMSCVM